MIGRRFLPMVLAGDESLHVSVLVRELDRAMKHPRVTAIRGDLQTPHLGLDPATWRSLAAELTGIVHCGADIRFTRSIEESRAVNLAGTQTMLRLARESRKLERFAYIGTTYIMGRDTGELPEREFCNANGFVNTYERAKYEAECAVLASLPQIPAAVFRLSSVAGAQSMYLQQVLRLIPRNPFPIIPGVADYRVDLISDEWAAAALALLFERHFRAGSVYHVCAGPERSIPVGMLVEMACAAMGVDRPPVMVPLEEFERFKQRFLNNGERELNKEILRSVSSFLPHLAIDQTFQNERTMALLRDDSIAPPGSVAVLRDELIRLTGGSTRVPVPPREPVR